MDSRDITLKPDRSEKFLEGIYELQKVLIDHYISIEGLPPYPVNVNTKSNQTLLKDFISRVVEELSEGHEAYQEVGEMSNEGALLYVEPLNQKVYMGMLNHLQNVGEEMADALHFFIELLIYSNIQPEDISRWIDKKTPNLEYETDILTKAILMGKMMLETETLASYGNNRKPTSVSAYDLLKPALEGSFNITKNLTFEQMDDFIAYHTVGRYYNPQHQYTNACTFWAITHHLNIARNFLKNKPWKQSEVMTQEIKFQEQLVIAFCLFMGALNVMGSSPEHIYYLYFKKNHINRFRIQSNY